MNESSVWCCSRWDSNEDDKSTAVEFENKVYIQDFKDQTSYNF